MLRESGLNTPDYVILASTNVSYLNDFFHGQGWKYLSIRCEPPKEFQELEMPVEGWSFYPLLEKDHDGVPRTPPHIAYIPAIPGALAIIKLINLGWTPIVCDGISFEDNQLAGGIVSKKKGVRDIYDFLVEAVLPCYDEPASVRRVTHGGKADIAVRLPQAIEGVGVYTVFAELYEALREYRRGPPIYHEFSYLRRPSGWKDERLIFWEGHITEDG